ncbi:MAG: quinolinate synthase NadA [Spirochaetes bacterium]|nr:quinolinate synthase NadA [Spirochaetota bacterium]
MEKNSTNQDTIKNNLKNQNYTLFSDNDIDLTENEIDNYKNEIFKLKKEKDIVILSHNYQRKEIQEIADFVGDSFELAKIIDKISSNKIIFCGVKFMAETAKIISPEKKIIFPEPKAGCPLASSISKQKLLEYKENYKNYTFICYINTNIEIKALCDIVVTSSNALKIIKKVKNKNIFFLPDMFLGEFIRNSLKKEYEIENTPIDERKNIVLHNGFCPVHQQFTEEDVKRLRDLYPDAPILAHPESSYFIQEVADYLVGTSGMIKLAGELPNKRFIIGTEIDMIHRLKALYPEKEFIPLSKKAICPNMKKITIQKVIQSIITENYEIIIDESLIEKAIVPIKRMIELA